ncbi:threonine-phosphate decarboxylase CobD [Nioella nitratireducens]|uniref:threonine-phosphate decarboxylase CobD n=1 Tax=Nioella nitratireducens TaxID=1287720 RepID=UPI0008FD20B7|nr:threonine-phosphate decarboxylase CobD [Nioella nitratireducens]
MAGSEAKRDHGGGVDGAVARYGGPREGWIDLSTGINPVAYPVPAVSDMAWTALPDDGAFAALEAAARRFWAVPDTAAVLAAPGASALIARLPGLAPAGAVEIPVPTYNEHWAAFRAAGWTAGTGGALVAVHPNNPDGRIWTEAELAGDRVLTVIDESFCDVMPEASLIHLATRPGVVVLKSFGKFWGLAGLRLGFAIARPEMIARMAAMVGPWAVSGPALETGTAALRDTAWAEATRARLAGDAGRLDAMMTRAGAAVVGGTTLFRLYDVGDAAGWQDRLAKHHVWSRIFPYSDRWLRLGLPGPAAHWTRLQEALA